MSWFYSYTFCPCATTGLDYNKNKIQHKFDFQIQETRYPNLNRYSPNVPPKPISTRMQYLNIIRRILNRNITDGRPPNCSYQMKMAWCTCVQRAMFILYVSLFGSVVMVCIDYFYTSDPRPVLPAWSCLLICYIIIAKTYKIFFINCAWGQSWRRGTNVRL